MEKAKSKISRFLIFAVICSQRVHILTYILYIFGRDIATSLPLESTHAKRGGRIYMQVVLLYLSLIS